MTPRRLLILGIAGHLCLLPVALRPWGADHEVLGIPLPALLSALQVIGLLVFTATAGFSYVAVSKRSDQLPVSWILRGGCLLTLAALVVPPFLSTDVFDYVLYGRVEAIHGANPYLSPPADFPDDPLLGTDAADWPTFVVPYGPISAYLQHWVSWLAGDSLWVAAYGFKILFAVCHVLIGVLIYLTLSLRDELAAKRGLQLYLWNPLVLLELVGSGHIDALMAVFLAAMCWAIANQIMGLATVAFGFAVLSKHGCAVLGPLLLALAWRRGQLAGFAKGLAVVAGVTAVLVVRYFLDPGSLAFLSQQAGVQLTSLQYFATLIGAGFGDVFRIIAFVIALAALVWAVIGITDAKSFGNRGAAFMLVVLVFAMPMFAPWYHLWWIPLLGIWTWRALDRLVVAVAILGPMSYVVRLANQSLALDYQIVQWSLGLALPLLWVICLERRRSSDRIQASHPPA